MLANSLFERQLRLTGLKFFKVAARDSSHLGEARLRTEPAG